MTAPTLHDDGQPLAAAPAVFPNPTSMDPSTSPTRPRREGFALVVAMIAIVVIGALIAGAFFTSTQEFRINRNSLVDQRAFAAADAGAAQPVQGWLRALNMSLANGATAGPDTLQLSNGAYAVRRATRLNAETYWVISDGYAGGTTGAMASRHRVNSTFRVSVPSFNIIGALTVRGRVEVQGSSMVDGTDGTPPNWGGVCPLPGPTLPGVNAPDTTLVCSGNCPQSFSAAPRIFGLPAEEQSAAAADTNTYYKYGDENWQSLVANADIKLNPGNYYTEPIEAGGKCVYGNTNWGDPARATACADHFPIIYVNGNLKLQANSIGQGILLVNGDVEMSGGFEFNGIVIARDDVKSTGTGNKITGGVFAGNTYTSDASSITGNSEIHYSSCAIERAGRGAGVVVRMKERGWAEVMP